MSHTRAPALAAKPLDMRRHPEVDPESHGRSARARVGGPLIPRRKPVASDYAVLRHLEPKYGYRAGSVSV